MFAENDRRIATRTTGSRNEGFAPIANSPLYHPLEEAVNLTEPCRVEPPSASSEVTEPYGFFTDLATSHILYSQQIRPAYALAAPTPLEVWRRNLEIVTAILTAAGVDFFAIPGFSLTRPVLGVDAADRARVCTALAMLCDTTGGRLSAPEPSFRQSELGLDHPVWARRTDMGDVPLVRADWLWTEPSRNLVYGAEYGCDVEFWSDTGDGHLLAPRHNRISPLVRRDGASVTAPGELFSALGTGPGTELPTVITRAEFARPGPDFVSFPIDVVYTWVDGADHAWLRRRSEADQSPYHAESANDARFIDREELRFSLRSLHMNAPWVRHVYLVTDQQRPHWLDESVPGLTVVDHRDLFEDLENLPTFNSHAIESQLHRIEGLSEHFLYFNDDMFLGRPLSPQAFFEPNGLARFFPAETFIGLDPVSAADTPPNAAFKNDRALVEQAFGRTISRMVKHVPYPMQRSVLAEMEKEFDEASARTAASAFRNVTDISTVTLQHYYAFLSGRAVAGKCYDSYLELGSPDLAEQLSELLDLRDRETFCINDAGLAPGLAEERSTLMRHFLEAYFPVPSPYERTMSI
ncbi:stealth family protein [Glycomyces buryatensis]|uniref:Sugar phosphotransferase n=1 Tax=Glycomyces buryatensis TaxID=2570927 RepID=A0A4S8QC33_9ACTN|nr:stealth family protein [Glycomyces buryatensis]THV38609.1 sugar phosphotransferase [Glycomyces buryatensis]